MCNGEDEQENLESFRDVVTSNVAVSDSLLKLIFENIDPLYDFHCSLLAELEDRLTEWKDTASDPSSKEVHKIGDIMERNMKQIKLYTAYIQKHDQILIELESEMKTSAEFNQACKEFELNKICYLPLNTFLLKPVQRLLYYKSILGRLFKEYTIDDPKYKEAKTAFEDVFEACKAVSENTKNLENLHKMIELDRDLLGTSDIVHPAREFIREGCLSKIRRKGPQPRMFFLFSDTLLYTTQGVTSTNQFRVRSQIPLHLMKIEEGGVELHGLYSFTIHNSCGKSFVVAATSPDERFKWMEDLNSAIAKAKEKEICSTCKTKQSEVGLTDDGNVQSLCSFCRAIAEDLFSLPKDEKLRQIRDKYPSPIKISKSPREPDSDDEEAGTLERVSSLDRRHAHVRTMSTRRVCWHRNTSISMNEYTLSVQNNLSGDLCRKFKNSSQWQKLWVVFTNFALFFFKSSEEDEPLASLPLIGYSVSKPTKVDNIDVDWAFKLQFKTHVYFFKADCEYTFGRWLEVLNSATRSASRTRIFSRMTRILKVKVIAARDLPVMDRASDLTDAFAEVRLGSTYHKTEVFRKSLNPVWNSEWFKFEADDEELQDEPLQIKILDYDMYSAHDSIGKVSIGLSPLLLKNGTNEMGGWLPVYDTLHGIRGYVHLKIKVEFFVDTNKYRQTSCGIQFFSTPGIPSGYLAVAMQGFVDILIVNDDPEYQWIEKIRSPRASNEARLRLFSKLSGEVHRRLGLKVIDAGGNAVIGYRQYFDIEGETGIVVRGIGTSVTLIRVEEATSSAGSLANSLDISHSPAVTQLIHCKGLFEKQQEAVLSRTSKNRSVSCRGNRTISTSSDGVDNLNELSALLAGGGESPEAGGVIQKDFFARTTQLNALRQKPIDELEFPFFTLTKPSPGFLAHIGGVVSSMSVKLLDKINNPDEPETREAWWNEIRAEIRSHAKAVGCQAVIGYSEWTTICDDLIILSASGTAAIVRLPDYLSDKLLDMQDSDTRKPRELKTSITEEDDEDDENKDNMSLISNDEPAAVYKKNNPRSDGFDCRMCHIPFTDVDLPFSMNISKCMLCRQAKVPDVIFATIEPPTDAAITGTGCLLQARVCRMKRREKDEAHAENVSQILPFLEYELHRQLLSKLKIKSMNAIFGLKMQITIGEQVIIGLMKCTMFNAAKKCTMFIAASKCTMFIAA
eukprot:gene10963-12124_t